MNRATGQLDDALPAHPDRVRLFLAVGSRINRAIKTRDVDSAEWQLAMELDDIYRTLAQVAVEHAAATWSTPPRNRQ